jgi:dihydrofolate synthase / folylpolyglutamate synthase
MFDTYEEFIAFSTQRMSSGRFGLSHLKDAMAILGNPQFDIPCVHIAGTNGKGSTTNYLRGVLEAAGYRVGTFTSPHLEVHNDRIRINDVFITNAKLLELGNRYHEFIIQHGLTMFEIDMLVAAIYFKEEKVDIALYEVGLGGRLDATNIILPELCLITNIGMDHMEYLGDTLEAIAGEKAGIIKPLVPVITGERKEECLKVFREVCLKNESTLDLTSNPVMIASDPDWVEFEYKGYKVHLKGPALYQTKNASLVIDAAQKLRASGTWQISDEAILKGLAGALWKGRFEVVHRDPTIILDGAHNDHGVQAILTSVSTLKKPVIAVFTALKDKNARSMLEKLLTVCDKIIVTEFSYYRGAKAVDLAGDLPVEVIIDPREALREGYRLAKDGSLLITGSLYFISDVRNIYLAQLIGKEHHD